MRDMGPMKGVSEVIADKDSTALIYPDTALNISRVTFAKCIRRMVIRVGVSGTLTRLKERVGRASNDCLLRIVANDAIAGPLTRASAALE